MARPPGTLRVGRYFAALLALLALLYLVVFFPGNRHKPKLGIDLVGGLRVVFSAHVQKGLPAPNSSQMTQARQILEDRINTTGVTGATVVVQGTNQLVVEIPNGTKTDIAKLGKAAVLNFRGLIAPEVSIACLPRGAKTAPGTKAPTGSAAPSSSGSSSAAPSSSAAGSSSGSADKSGNDAAERPLKAPSQSKSPSKSTSATKSAKPSTSTSPSVTPSGSSSAAAPTCTSDPFAAVVKADPKLRPLLKPNVAAGESGLNAESCPSPAMPKVNGKTVPCHGYTSLTSAQKQLISSALSHFDCASAQDEPDLLGNYYIACDATGTAVDLLGHVVVRGAQIDSASAVAPSTNGQGNTDWTVNLNLGGAGADNWSAWTSKFNTKKLGLPDSNGGQATSCAPPSTPCSLFVGFTLDGAVLSLPITNASLSTQTTVSGSFTEKSAKDLAQELNYGKLPITFKADSIRNVSATLGTSQLHGAFIAGGIGLILVVLYSLIYYRALGLVTIASLIVSAALTYSMLVILATQIGFTLDLAGIAGFIVALGITADSFVVFFERIKDEVHEGRSLRVAVPRAWVRARRTILSADTVSFLAAAILYFFASADVKGFAFTLGMSTILDLVVVFLFTHPMVSLLSRSRAFGSARFTGLANVRAGGIAAPSADDERQLARPRRTPRRSATATLEKPEVEEQTTEDAVDEAGPAEPAGEAEQPRRRTTPQAGTAAERAAQRRARMRQRDEGEQG